MTAADAQSETYNLINLNSFTIGTYSQTLQVNAVNAASNYTVHTMGGNTAPIFVYQITNNGADNTGIVESGPDPVYGDNWQTWLVVTISGVGYQTIMENGFDQVFTLGNTVYGVIHLNADMLTKWKVGTTYEMGYTGGQTASFSLDLSGYSGAGVTMNVTAYAYCDPSFAQTHGGNFGNDKVQLSTSHAYYITHKLRMALALNPFKQFLQNFIDDTHAKVSFDLMGIVLMIVAIAVGQFAGGYLVPYLGQYGAGILGSLAVGAVIYVIYTFISKGKFTLKNLALFAILIYVANIIAGYVSTMIGIGGGYMTLLLGGIFMSFLWGWVGGKNAKSKVKSPVKL